MIKNYSRFFISMLLVLFCSASTLSQSKVKGSKYLEPIKKYLSQSKYKLSESDIQNFYVDSEYLSKKTQITHVFLGQKHQGIEVFNAISSIAIKDNQVFYVGSALVSNVADKINTVTPSISQVEAINIVASKFNTPQILNPKLLNFEENTYVYDKSNLFFKDIPVQLVYTNVNGELKLSWDLSLYTLDAQHNWNARVDAVTGEILQSSDYVISCDFGPGEHNHVETHNVLPVKETNSFNLFKTKSTTSVGGAEYNVYELPAESPNTDPRTLVVDPENIVASPFGWHDTDGVSGPEFTITRGNNVHAYEDSNGSNSSSGNEPNGGAALSFNFPINLNLAPVNYRAAATVNLFYVSNMMHDIYYNYGFDEAAGNFQENNYGNGGIGGDYAIVEAQDGSGTNNANFSTPADGGNGRMQMFLWTTANPNRDGDLDNNIVAHEYGHGISIRLGGGPNNSSCLSGQEQQGEGWADWVGLVITMKPSDVATTNRSIANYSRNLPQGIRPYYYTTNMAVNPHTYDDIKVESVPHGVGSVWCAMLWDLTWAYIDKYGFDPDVYNGNGGNNKVMQLVLDGLKLQPCGSGFVDSRDALLAADVALTGGQDQCLIWEVFARRGLGVSAIQGTSGSRADGTEAFDMPASSILAEITNDTCGSSAVNLLFANFDANSISQFDYTYTVDGGAPIAGTYSNNIASCSVSPASAFDYGNLTPGTHEIVVTGTNPVSAPKSFIVNVNAIGQNNVVNTFENAADELVAYDEVGNGATWERGSAAGTVLNAAAANNTSVYATNLDGIHGDQNKFYLLSKCYDLSNLVNATVQFDLGFDIEPDWDILYLEYSTNNGSTWNVLGDATDPDWYNSNRTPNGIDCFNCIGRQWTGDGNSPSSHSAGGLNKALHAFSYPLSAFDTSGSAETNMVFRFVYQADEAYADEGAIIDNFVVSGTLSVEDNQFDKLAIFPNPTNGNVTITSGSSLKDAKVNLVDVMGRNLINSANLQRVNNDKITLNISNLSVGTYFLILEDETRRSVKQIVKY